MLKLFEYNWQVRQDWFDWCDSVTEEELLKKRTGGVGSILHTLHHIVDVEYSWICDMKGKIPQKTGFEECSSLQKIGIIRRVAMLKSLRLYTPGIATWKI